MELAPKIASRKWFKSSITYIVVIITISIFISSEVGSFLTIHVEGKDLPVLDEYHATTHVLELPTVPNISSIVAPINAMDDDLYNRSISLLVAAIQERTGTSPAILDSLDIIPAGNVLAIGSNDRNGYVVSDVSLPTNITTDSFALRSYVNGSHTILSIVGGSKLGDAYGIYWLTEEIHTGVNLGSQNIYSQNITIIPDFEYRLVDKGGVGMLPDEAGWRIDDYSLDDRDFEDLYMPEAPYINDTAFTRIEDEFYEYVHKMISYGYNYVVMRGFLAYVNFDLVGNGFEIYSVDSVYRARQDEQIARFGALFEYAADLGMKVVLVTDMVALSEPLRNYFESSFGTIDGSDERIWDVYQKGFEELFTNMPYLEGIMIRIGEAGAAYNLATELYTSELYIKDTPSVQLMLNKFLETMEAFNKTLIFRTWSVGIGEMGDIHTNPETYDRVLEDINSPNLIVSTKYTTGDFYSYLEFNPTLLLGDQKRIIEFQSRREYEGSSAFPNYMGSMHQAALQFAAQNENLVGMWVWTQYGGPMRAGPMNIYPFHGFWLHTDSNVYITAKLAWDVNLDLVNVTEGWVANNFGTDPDVVSGFTEMLLLSHTTVQKGLYINEIAKEYGRAFGLEPPPQMWIFEWDRLCGVSTVMSMVYELCKDNLTAAIQEGYDAVLLVDEMKTLVSNLTGKFSKGSELYDKILASLDYEKNLFETLASYRNFSLNYYAWLNTGNGEYELNWKQALEEFNTNKEIHMTTYGEDLDFPAYYFEESDAFIVYAQRNASTLWLVRVLFGLLLLVFVFGSERAQSYLPEFKGKQSFRLILLGLLQPWKLKEMETTKNDTAILVTLNYILILGSFMVFTQFLAWYTYSGIFLLLSIGLVSSVFVHQSEKNQSYANSMLATSSPVMAVILIVLMISSVTGPALFWSMFWTQSIFQNIILVVIVGLLLWLLFSVFAVSRSFVERPTASIVGRIVFQIGLLLGVLGSLLGIFSLEASLAVINKELLLIPFALSEILGITGHLDIPQTLPIDIAVIGVILIGIGLLTELSFFIFRKRRKE